MAIIDTFHLGDEPQSEYLTPEELNVTQTIFDGLLEVRRRLLTGELEYTNPNSELGVFYAGSRGFNMRAWTATDGVSVCGTVHCIGGWLKEWGCIERPDYHPELAMLFASYNTVKFYSKITAEEAAEAIRRYLQGRHLNLARADAERALWLADAERALWLD